MGEDEKVEATEGPVGPTPEELIALAEKVALDAVDLEAKLKQYFMGS